MSDMEHDANDERTTLMTSDVEHSSREIERLSSMSAIQHPVLSRSCLKFPDFFFGIAWIASLAVVAGIAIKFGPDNLDDIDLDDTVLTDEKTKDAMRNVVNIFMLCFLWALCFAQCLMMFLMRCGGLMVHGILVTIYVSLGLMGALAIEYSYWYVGCFFLVLAFLCMVAHWCNRARINFSTATLHVGCEIVLAFPTLQVIAFLGALASVVAFFTVALASFGYYEYSTEKWDDDGTQSQNQAFAFLFFVFVFFWTGEVFKYITLATTAGTAQTWWYAHKPAAFFTEHPAVYALARACTYELGTICFGAMLVALIETIATCVHYLKKQAAKFPGGCCVTCCLSGVECCLHCCASVLDYMNKYAFVYVGIHGYSFLYAGKQVVTLFATKGVLVIGTDFFLEVLFFVCAVVVALSTAFVGLIIEKYAPGSWTRGISEPELVCATVGGLGGYFVANVVFSLVHGAAKASMILFMENPHVLQHTHPADYKRLSKVWHQLGNDEADDNTPAPDSEDPKA